MKAYLIPGVILTILVAALVLVVSSWSDHRTMSVDFPEKLNHRVVVNPESDKESSHIEYRKDDGTRVIAEIDYTNGVTSYVFYRPDGKAVAKVLDFYPEDNPDEEKRRLKGETYFADDGHSLKTHLIYREDGTVERHGARLPDGMYKTVYFGADGKSVEKVRVFDQREYLFSEVAYREDGSIEYKTEKDDGYLTTTSFREDGSVFSIVENVGTVQKGRYFQADGTTLKAKFEKYTWKLEFEYFDEKGVLQYVVNYYDDRMEVQGISEADKILYEQDLKLVGDKTSYCDGTYNFTEVTEYHMWGPGRYQKKVKRVIEFASDGKTPLRVTVPTNKSLKYIYTLDDQGVVTAVEEKGNQTGYGSGGATLPAVSYKVGDKVDIDPELVVRKEFECLSIPERLKTQAPVYYPYSPF